jgi:hypothetical protein
MISSKVIFECEVRSVVIIFYFFGTQATGTVGGSITPGVQVDRAMDQSQNE